MKERDRVKLLFGPYGMPKCKIGRSLRCAMRGRITVRKVAPGPWRWFHHSWHLGIIESMDFRDNQFTGSDDQYYCGDEAA
jgi:hypothetical protein